MISATIQQIEIIEPENTPMYTGTVLHKAPFEALTTADAGTIDTGDAPTDTTIGNMRTRIGEIETGLKKLNVVK